MRSIFEGLLELVVIKTKAVNVASSSSLQEKYINQRPQEISGTLLYFMSKVLRKLDLKEVLEETFSATKFKIDTQGDWCNFILEDLAQIKD